MESMVCSQMVSGWDAPSGLKGHSTVLVNDGSEAVKVLRVLSEGKMELGLLYQAVMVKRELSLMVRP